MGIDDHFEDGHIYKASFQLRTNKENGYRLHQDSDVVTVRVNGQKATSVSIAGSTTVNVEYNFGECKNAVYEVEVQGLTYPRENDTPDLAASVVDETLGRVVSNGVNPLLPTTMPTKWRSWCRSRATTPLTATGRANP